ncbi:retinol dehydrogenase 8-like [Pristis pectinata]|uniref:retinol dehydrogenase 8-like n=1 Tax=Pristis pectinata TaxID=685728 RepID=UPI00223DA8D3|nr:retinol dehydrogenase 8-like [Pristis pectinata]
MEQKTVLITGCSTGIGLAIAAKLATDEQKRFKVYATMRNLKKREALEEAAGEAGEGTLHIRQLDVCDEESIQNCLNSIPERHIDILINNAGIGLIGPVECLSIEEMKAVFETNFFGVVRMIKAVLPDMKARRNGHIVVMSSVLGLQGIMFNDVYAASKFAVEGFCESLVVQTLKFNINITLIEPGPVVTEFEKKVFEEAVKADYSSTDPDTADMFVKVYLENTKSIFSSTGQRPEDVAEETVKVITSEKPPFRLQTNPLYTPMTALKHVDPTGELATDVFYKMLFQYNKLMRASVGVVRLLRWKAQKMQQGLKMLGLY